MSDSGDLWDELGGFEVEVDDSAAVARAERIDAARRAGKGYSAKFDEPGWFNDPAQAARAKGAARPALFAAHHAYFEQRFGEVVDAGLELLRAGVKEETEVLDLMMRAALRCGREREDGVLALAKRWRDFPNLPALSYVSARVLLASSPLSSAVPSSDGATSPVTAAEVLSATLAALRLHPTLPLPRTLLRSILAPQHPSLAAALDAQSTKKDVDDAALEAEWQRVEASDADREILSRVLGLGQAGAAGEDELEGAGRDVRSL